MPWLSRLLMLKSPALLISIAQLAAAVGTLVNSGRSRSLGEGVGASVCQRILSACCTTMILQVIFNNFRLLLYVPLFLRPLGFFYLNLHLYRRHINLAPYTDL